MTTVYMSTHPTVVNAWKPWFKEIEKATKGEIKINYYNPNTLTPLNDHFDSTISGMINIGGNDCPRKAGLFKLSSVMELPGMAPSAECGSLVFWDLYQKYPELQKEYKDVKILWLWASATYQLHTTQKPVKTTDDLKGLKIICWNKKSVEIIKVLGANPIMIPPTDTYLALERGMADGVLCPLAPIVSFKISEAVKYTTVCDIFLNGFWAAMGHDLWESLTPEYQKLFVETTGKGMAQKSGLTLDQGAIADSKKLSAKGHKFIVLSKEKRAKWLDATKAMREAWVKDMESQGYKNARAIMEDAFKLSEKYAAETGRGFAQ
jgi:TRAP-type C4-dicarboxylate transport system substrate-binding protein